MRDKNSIAFVDTNILIYRSFGTDAQKEKIQHLLVEHDGRTFISVQVLNEFINASVKKKFFDKEEKLDDALSYFIGNFNVVPVQIETVLQANKLRKKYKLSYYDSVIVATALENHCEILYSEDLQHGAKIERRLKIVNPFV